MSRSVTRLAGALAASGLIAAVLGGPVLAQSPSAAVPAGSPVAGAVAPVLGTAEAPRVVVVSIAADKIEPATVEVVRGETIKFLATNVSDAETELIVGLKTDVDADAGDSLKEAEHIAAGQTGTIGAYPFSGDGPFAYGDQLPGHYAAGAKGDIVLVDALTPPVAPVPGTAEAPRVVVVSIAADKIEPATVEVVRGETIKFLATNVSDAETELIVGLKTDVDADAGDSLKEAEHIAAGQTGTIGAYPFSGDGPFAYGDQLPGHYAAGAKGDIVLVDALSQ